MISGTELIAAADRHMDTQPLAEYLRDIGFETDALLLLAMHVVKVLSAPKDATPQSLAATGFIAGFTIAWGIKDEIA